MHITKSENQFGKDYIPLDSNYMTFWKGKTIETIKESVVAWGYRGEKINCQRTEKF